MFTRAVNLDRVLFDGGVTFERVTKTLRGGTKHQADINKAPMTFRRKEEERLQKLHRQTLAKWSADTGGPADGPPHV